MTVCWQIEELKGLKPVKMCIFFTKKKTLLVFILALPDPFCICKIRTDKLQFEWKLRPPCLCRYSFFVCTHVIKGIILPDLGKQQSNLDKAAKRGPKMSKRR